MASNVQYTRKMCNVVVVIKMCNIVISNILMCPNFQTKKQHQLQNKTSYALFLHTPRCLRLSNSSKVPQKSDERSRSTYFFTSSSGSLLIFETSVRHFVFVLTGTSSLYCFLPSFNRRVEEFEFSYQSNRAVSHSSLRPETISS